MKKDITEAIKWYQMAATGDGHHGRRDGRRARVILKELNKRGIKTAVFSDYRCVEDKIRAIGLEPKLFDYCEAAPELGGLKPNRTLFERLLKIMRVKPEQALMIGDREDTDGQGARNGGMKYLKV